MANFMKFKVDADKDLHLNVENVYRVGLEANTPTDADLLFYYNVASTSNTKVWAAKVTLASAITQLKATQLEALVRKVNQRPGGIVEAKDVIGDTVFLSATAPFSVDDTPQPS